VTQDYLLGTEIPLSQVLGWGRLCESHNLPHPGRIACCSASNSRPPATKTLHTIRGNNTSIVSSSWWWAYKCPKHVEQIISAIKYSVASSWFSCLEFVSRLWSFVVAGKRRRDKCITQKLLDILHRKINHYILLLKRMLCLEQHKSASNVAGLRLSWVLPSACWYLVTCIKIKSTKSLIPVRSAVFTYSLSQG